MAPKKAEEGTFKKGDKVKARWSGSNRYYDAKVIDCFVKTCKVQYEDGSVSNVKLADLKVTKAEEVKQELPKLRGRPRSRSSSASRQTKSRSRSPARTKEVKETVTKTDRKSNERATKPERKSSSKVEKNVKKSEENSNSVSKDEPDFPVKSLRSEDRVSTSTTTVVKNNLNIKEAWYESEGTSSNAVHVRTSTRLAALHAQKSAEKLADNRSSFAKQNAVSKDGSKYSDDEEEEIETPVIVASKPKRILQVLVFLMTFLKMILIPGLLLFFVFSCTKKQCTILEMPLFYSKWRDFENAVRMPLLAVGAFHAIQCVLSLIPLGKKIKSFSSDTSEVKEYRLNGFYSLILSIAVFAICSYYGLYTNWGYDKFRSIGTSCFIYCTLWALALQLKARFKGDGSRKSKVPLIGNFYDGSYVNPTVFKMVDVKTSFIRSGLIGLVLLNSSILLKYFLMKGTVTTPLALTAGMQIFFAADMLFREEKLLSTATYTTDSVGYSFLLSTGFFVPVALGLQNVFNFIRDTKAGSLPHWCSIAMVFLYFVGYGIYLTSSNMKHNFRKNPYSPSLTDVDSIPTSKKRRLISSSSWGVVRHPNYVGLLIMAIAWTLPCGFSHFVPFGPLILLAGALIIRSFRVENECKEKYGPAWQNYTEKVRSRFIPFVF